MLPNNITGDSLFMNALDITKKACEKGGILYGGFARLLVKRGYNKDCPGNVNTINIIFPNSESMNEYINSMGLSFRLDEDRYVWKNIIEVKVTTTFNKNDLRFDIDCLFIRMIDEKLVYETFGNYQIESLCNKIINNEAEILYSHLRRCRSQEAFINNLNILIRAGWKLKYKNFHVEYIDNPILQQLLA